MPNNHINVLQTHFFKRIVEVEGVILLAFERSTLLCLLEFDSPLGVDLSIVLRDLVDIRVSVVGLAANWHFLLFGALWPQWCVKRVVDALLLKAWKTDLVKLFFDVKVRLNHDGAFIFSKGLLTHGVEVCIKTNVIASPPFCLFIVFFVVLVCKWLRLDNHAVLFLDHRCSEVERQYIFVISVRLGFTNVLEVQLW